MDAKIFLEKVQARYNELLAGFEAPPDMTPAEAEIVKQKLMSKAKSDVKAGERDAALTKLIELAKNVAGDDVEIIEACNLLSKRQRAERGERVARTVSAPRTSRFTVLEVEFPEVGMQVSEDALFAKYKMGRKDVYWLIADAIKGAKDPNTRKWISFDPNSGLYTYESQGETPPDGWTGYVPSSLKAPKAADVSE
jgi:hypothetical protein